MNRDQYEVLFCRIKDLLKRDKQKNVRGLAENVDGHINANDLRPNYRALKKPRFEPYFQLAAIQTADDCLISGIDGQTARWAEEFCMMNSSSCWGVGGGC